MNFECGYCRKSFVRESAFMKHECAPMLRAREIQTPIGQSSYSIYCKWMQSNRRKAPTIQVFMTSKFYNQFIKIAKYVKKVDLVDIQFFINFMKMKDFPPSMWTSDPVYSMYMNHLDRNSDPFEMAKITINELYDWAEEHECPISQVFLKMPFNECMDMIRKRKLSPWILLRSHTFKQLLLNSSEEQRQIFNELIPAPFWKLKFSQHPEVLQVMAELVKELSI